MILVQSVYEVTTSLPESERFVLVPQINRCAISIPSNIAEGSGRTSEKEFIRFLRISISSSYELETQLILVSQLYKIELNGIIDRLKSLQKMIGGFIRRLKSLE